MIHQIKAILEAKGLSDEKLIRIAFVVYGDSDKVASLLGLPVFVVRETVELPSRRTTPQEAPKFQRASEVAEAYWRAFASKFDVTVHQSPHTPSEVLKFARFYITKKVPNVAKLFSDFVLRQELPSKCDLRRLKLPKPAQTPTRPTKPVKINAT